MFTRIRCLFSSKLPPPTRTGAWAGRGLLVTSIIWREEGVARREIWVIAGSVIGRTATARPLAECEIGLPQPLELLVLWMHAAQIGVCRFGCGYPFQNRFGIVDVGAPVDNRAERCGIEPAAAGMPRIFQHRKAQLDLGLGRSLMRCGCAWIRRNLERGCV